LRRGALAGCCVEAEHARWGDALLGKTGEPGAEGVGVWGLDGSCFGTLRLETHPPFRGSDMESVSLLEKKGICTSGDRLQQMLAARKILA
jgi:hypothetical protein